VSQPGLQRARRDILLRLHKGGRCRDEPDIRKVYKYRVLNLVPMRVSLRLQLICPSI
jgi:hypothetical protein